ncbi:hypothetical protein [Paenibacillus sp. FSL K6-2524]|uniref:hypothetical protein n=1 Tax=Paenibacillus sp. FSL K6-2524 TaxID=2954516 RepID=UPI0030F67BE7
MNLTEIYNEFINFDAASKFYITLITGLIIFLYRTFLNMYSESEKQTKDDKNKAGEAIAKLDAYLSIYVKSNREKVDQDKLIEKMGESYLYLNYKIRKKIRLYYNNRSEACIITLRKVIAETIDAYGTPNEEKLMIEQIMSYVGKLIKPIAPIITILVMLIIAIFHYSQFITLQSTWDKIVLTLNFLAIIFPIMIVMGILSHLIENFKDFHNPGFSFWIIIIGAIICPIIMITINNNYLYISAFIQFFLFVFLLIRKSPTNE